MTSEGLADIFAHKVADLINGWNARDWLDGHQRSPCAACALASRLHGTGLLSTSTVAEMVCQKASDSMGQVIDAEQAITWFQEKEWL